MVYYTHYVLEWNTKYSICDIWHIINIKYKAKGNNLTVFYLPDYTPGQSFTLDYTPDQSFTLITHLISLLPSDGLLPLITPLISFFTQWHPFTSLITPLTSLLPIWKYTRFIWWIDGVLKALSSVIASNC